MSRQFLSHVYGEGVINRPRQLAYFHIPKNASSWCKRYVAQLGVNLLEDTWHATNLQQEQRNEYLSVVLLRDPLKRWYSYCHMERTVDQVDKNHIMSMLTEPKKIAQMFSNEHLAPQTWFFDYDANNTQTRQRDTVFFNVDEDLSANLQHFFKNQGFKNWENCPEPFNQSPVTKQRKRAIKEWKRWLRDPDIAHAWRTLYQDDIELIRLANFYKAW